MSDATMTFSPDFARALLEWDERLFKLYQARSHAKTIIDPLRDMKMEICAKNAQKIYLDLDMQLRTGELLIRMRTLFLEQHTLSIVEHEQWRQFTSTAMVWYELTEEEAGTEYGEKVCATREVYITAAQLTLAAQVITAMILAEDAAEQSITDQRSAV